MFILVRLTQHVSGIIMPIVRRTDYVNNCMWSMPGCAGSSRAELGHELCALCESWYTTVSYPIHAYVLVPKSFMKFMFSTVYRVTQKDFYARPYTSMWAPAVARQISKRYSSYCHVFISMWGVISSTASMIRCLKSARSRTFLLYTNLFELLCTLFKT